MRARYLLAALVLMGTVAAASEAEAQYGYGYGPPVRILRPGFNREGLTIGFAVGGGVIGADHIQTTGGGWLSFRIGGMLTPRLALLFDTETLFFPATVSTGGAEISATGYAGVGTVALQIFLDPTPLWLKFGAGFAYYGAQVDCGIGASCDFGTNYGFGATLGAGVDLVKFPHPWAPFALSLEFQVTPMFFSANDNVGGNGTSKLVNATFGVGFQWY